MFRTGQATIEPTLGIDAGGRIFVDACEGRCTGIGGGGTTVVRSADGGAHWTDVGETLAGIPSHQINEDPFLYVDRRTGRVFHDDALIPCQQLSTSDDGGHSWSSTVTACDERDNQKIATGPPPQGGAAPLGYPNLVYDCAINGGEGGSSSTMRTCDRSLDGGVTFAPTGEPAFGPDPCADTAAAGLPAPFLSGYGGGATVVGPDGTLYLPKGQCGEPFLAISHDEGATWTRVQIADNGVDALPCGLNGLVCSDAAAGVPDFTTGVAVDSANNLYYTWSARDLLPYLSVSRDGGMSWSKPLMVAPPGLRAGLLPAVAADDPGGVAIVFMGSTNLPGPPFPSDPNSYTHSTWNGYIVETGDALAANPLFYGGPVNDPARPFIVGACGPIRCQNELDFIGVQISPSGIPYGVFVDACGLSRSSPSCTFQEENGEGVVGTVVSGPRL